MMSVTEQRQAVMETYGKLPLAFIPNAGQMKDAIRYYAQGRGFRYAFSPEQISLTFFERDSLSWFGRTRTAPLAEENEEQGRCMRGINLAWRFLNARPGAAPEGMLPVTGTINYFRGNNSSQHFTQLPMYREILYRQVWPSIDVVFQGYAGNLKYDVLLQPGACVGDIRFHCEGADGIRLDEEGNLLIATPMGTFMDLKPVAYQKVENIQRPVGCSFVIRSETDGSQSIGFEVTEEFDPNLPLVIDPILFYSTYLGGSANDEALSIAVDASGNAYVTGYTESANFPTTPGAFQTAFGSGSDEVFVTKLNLTGTALVYSTFLGGNGTEFGNGIAVDSFGNAYVTGSTTSTDFPTTPGAFQPIYGGGPTDAFVTKLNATGTALIYSTYLGGTAGDAADAITVDASGNAFVFGSSGSANFPITPGAFQTTVGLFITKLNAAGSALIYSTFLGGSGVDSSSGIAADAAGNAYVTGFTQSADFPTTAGAFDTVLNGTQDAFVTKLNATGTALVYSTYLGGSNNDVAFGIAVDTFGNAHVTGFTASADFPTTAGAFDTTISIPDSAFVTKLNAAGTALIFSTFLGGNGGNQGFGITVDASGNVLVTGETESATFPITPDAVQNTFGGAVDAFMTALNPAGTALVFSTYLGGNDIDRGFGIAVDAIGNAYVAGSTHSANFPTTAGAFDTVLGGSVDGFISKIAFVQSFSTGVIANQSAAGPVASAIQVLISNDNSSHTSNIEIVAFYLSGTSRVPFVHEVFGIAPGTVVSRSYSTAAFTAFEIQYSIAGAALANMLVSVFPIDDQGNAVAAGRVIQAEAEPIFTITPVP
ncbi:SBBP repeat-containing protein [Paenibacillus solisilvae]|uniref:SBBP repeat-containing protein n=1 Tax=Paenibacillus solisilvae TaxID=2486751 RepID=A0ABW0W555_9BACL